MFSDFFLVASIVGGGKEYSSLWLVDETVSMVESPPVAFSEVGKSCTGVA